MKRQKPSSGSNKAIKDKLWRITVKSQAAPRLQRGVFGLASLTHPYSEIKNKNNRVVNSKPFPPSRYSSGQAVANEGEFGVRLIKMGVCRNFNVIIELLVTFTYTKCSLT
jgi:hypothetical protein